MYVVRLGVHSVLIAAEQVRTGSAGHPSLGTGLWLKKKCIGADQDPGGRGRLWWELV